MVRMVNGMEIADEKIIVDKPKHDKRVYTFPNGTTLVYYEQNMNKCTDVNVGFRIPRVDTPKENEIIGVYKNLVFYQDENGIIRVPLVKPGLPHFVEHLFLSSLENKKKTEIFDSLVRTNTIYNAETTQDSIAFQFNCPSKFNEQFFSLYKDLIFRTKYDLHDLENEKKPVYQELEATIDDSTRDDSINDILTGSFGNLTGEDILGIDKKIIDTFNAAEALRFVKSFFTKENMIISVVSDRPFAEIKKLVKEKFVDAAPSLPETKITTPKLINAFNSDSLICTTPSKHNETAKLVFALKGTENYEKNEVYSVVEDFLLNNFNGRLISALRNENAKVYTPQFYVNNSPAVSLKYFYIQTTPENVKSCFTIMTSILSDLATKGISDNEFEGFKQMWSNRRDRASSVKFNSAENLFYKILYGQKPFVGHFNNEISNLTKDDINKYLKETYSKANCRILVSGNYNPKDIPSLGKFLEFRPFDKYMDENYSDNEGYLDFLAYLKYSAKHPDEPCKVQYVVDENLMKLMEKEQSKDDKPTNKGNKKEQTSANKKKTDDRSNKSTDKKEKKLACTGIKMEI